MIEHLVVVRVKPGSARNKVGGRYGDANSEVLVVAVQAPAVDGKANEAVISALAQAFGMRGNRLHLVRGHTSRTKQVIFEVSDGVEFARTLNELLGTP